LIWRCNRSRFLPESLAVLFFDLVDGHNAAKPGIPCRPHLDHTTVADGFKDFAWAELISDRKGVSIGWK